MDSGHTALLNTDLWERCGSLHSMLFTLFQAITGRAEWSQLLRPLEVFSWRYTLAGGLYIAFLSFGILNVATGIMVCYVSRVRDELKHQEKALAMESNHQTIEGLRQLLEKQGVHARVTEKQCRKVLAKEGEGNLHDLGQSLDGAKRKLERPACCDGEV